jgi:hypothetical protein
MRFVENENNYEVHGEGRSTNSEFFLQSRRKTVIIPDIFLFQNPE